MNAVVGSLLMVAGLSQLVACDHKSKDHGAPPQAAPASLEQGNNKAKGSEATDKSKSSDATAGGPVSPQPATQAPKTNPNDDGLLDPGAPVPGVMTNALEVDCPKFLADIHKFNSPSLEGLSCAKIDSLAKDGQRFFTKYVTYNDFECASITKDMYIEFGKEFSGLIAQAKSLFGCDL